jgi:hypothetical protein
MGKMLTLGPVFQRHGLSEQQQKFVSALMIGKSAADSAEAAGFHKLSWSQLMAHPAVAAAVHECMQLALQADAPVNLQTLRKIRDDEKAPAGVRSEIALKLMRLAGHVEPTKRDDSDAHRSLSEMTGEELRRYIDRNQEEIDRLEGELAARAKPVSAPDSAPNESADDTNFLE